MIPLPEPSSFTPSMPESLGVTTAMQPLGSTSDVGKTITAPSSQTLDAVLERFKAKFIPMESKALQTQPKPLPPSIAPKPPQRNHRKFTKLEKAELTEYMGQLCSMQKAYGKAVTDVEALVEGYCLILDRFTLAQITQAMKDYMVTHDDIPSPANIAQLIDPSLAPLSESVYIQICKKRILGNPYSISKEERQYIQSFEQQELRKVL